MHFTQIIRNTDRLYHLNNYRCKFFLVSSYIDHLYLSRIKMCLGREIKYYSSNESLNENNDLEWPLTNGFFSKLVVACNTCFYPITFEEHIVHEIRDENNISFGIVVPKKLLFSRTSIFIDKPLEQWRTEVYCPNCSVILSFLSPNRNRVSYDNFSKILNYISFGEPIVILWTRPLFRGSEMEAFVRFQQFNA